MKQKLAQFMAGLMIYFIFGLIIVYVAGEGLPGGWSFVIIWSVAMALAHAFILEPMRASMARKRTNRKNNL